jgi:hypothetical protein
MMPRYFIGMYQPEGIVPGPEVLGPVMQDMSEFMAELSAAGSLVFSNGFDQSVPPTVVTSDGTTIEDHAGSVLVSEVQLGGFTVVDLSDAGAAREVAARLAGITGLPIEVRQFAVRS